MECDVGSLSSSTESSSGLEIPEGCELARRIVRSQEEHVEVWAQLLGFTIQNGSISSGDESISSQIT